jgi:hypothetical protein
MESITNELTSKLAEQISKLADLEAKTKELAEERRVVEEKEVDNNYDIHFVKLEIRRLQNELGSSVLLTTANEKLLRKHLIMVEGMINRIDTEESSIILKFEVPNQDDLPYSIHVNMSNRFVADYVGFDDTELQVIIKTRSSAVERILRETVSQYDNMHSDFANKSDEEIKDFEMNVRREWVKSFHMDKHIRFIHKE